MSTLMWTTIVGFCLTGLLMATIPLLAVAEFVEFIDEARADKLARAAWRAIPVCGALTLLVALISIAQRLTA